MSVIQLTVSCTVSLVQLIVQCCILTGCCGFQFALQLEHLTCCYSMSVIQLTVSCTVSLVQLTVECCIQTVCCGFKFALQFVTFNLLLQNICHSAECLL